jgi:hypothetical protein
MIIPSNSIGCIAGFEPFAPSGLVIHVDANNRNSYSGSGNTWADLSGSSNNFTLTNSPTFGTVDNGSYFQFDGTSSYALCATNASFNALTTMTTEILFADNAISGTQAIFGDGSAVVGTNQGFGATITSTAGGVIGTRDATTFTSTAISATWRYSAGNYLWNHYVITWTVSGANVSGNWYLNNSAGTAWTLPRNSISSSTPFSIAARPGAGSALTQFFSGRIALFRMYNKIIDTNEIRRNYNQYKSRYGLP